MFMHSSLTAELPPLAVCSLCAELSACHWALSLSLGELTDSQPIMFSGLYLLVLIQTYTL